MPTYEERIEGALLGLLVGDALGVPYEFHEPEDIPPLAKIEMEPPRGFRRAHPAASVGAWSDDGAQALCLLESLLHVGSFDVGDFVQSRHHQHGNVCGCCVRAKFLADLKPGHLGHHDVEEDEVGRKLRDVVEGFWAVGGGAKFAAKVLEVGEEEFEVLLVVVYEQDPTVRQIHRRF